MFGKTKQSRKDHLADEVKATSITREEKEKLFSVFKNFPDCFDGTLRQISLMEQFIDSSSVKLLSIPVWLLAEKGDAC